MYHGLQAGMAAEGEFERIFVKKDLPDEIPEVKLTAGHFRFDELLLQVKTAESKSEARRLIQQGGVTIDGEKITDPFTDIVLKNQMIIKVGKRKFVKIIL